MKKLYESIVITQPNEDYLAIISNVAGCELIGRHYDGEFEYSVILLDGQYGFGSIYLLDRWEELDDSMHLSIASKKEFCNEYISELMWFSSLDEAKSKLSCDNPFTSDFLRSLKRNYCRIIGE